MNLLELRIGAFEPAGIVDAQPVPAKTEAIRLNVSAGRDRQSSSEALNSHVIHTERASSVDASCLSIRAAGAAERDIYDLGAVRWDRLRGLGGKCGGGLFSGSRRVNASALAPLGCPVRHVLRTLRTHDQQGTVEPGGHWEAR